jgi:outer membrane protein W
MKKLLVALAAFVFLSIGLTGQVRLGLSGGYGMPSDSNYKGGLAFGFQAGLGLGEHFAVEIGWGSFKGDVLATEAGLSAGSLNRMPIELSVQARFPLGNKKLIPYIFAGGGYSLNSFTLDSAAVAPWTALGITLEENVNGAVAFHGGAGLDYFLTDKLALNLNVKYLISKASGSWSQTDDETNTAASGTLTGLSLNTLSISFGLKYSF